MKTIEFALGSKTMHLFYNGEAMFRCNELDKDMSQDAPDWISRMLDNTLDGKRLLCRVAHILAEQGELCRRYLQYDKERILSEDEIQALMTPMLLVQLRGAVMNAINEGYSSNSAEDDGDIDVGLASLEKKTGFLR